MKINEFVPDTQVFQAIDKTAGAASSTSGDDTAGSFYNILKSKLDDVNDTQIKATNSTDALVNGSETDVSKVMLDTEQAKMSLELAVQIRNKLVDAYQELNRMQV